MCPDELFHVHFLLLSFLLTMVLTSPKVQPGSASCALQLWLWSVFRSENGAATDSLLLSGACVAALEYARARRWASVYICRGFG